MPESTVQSTHSRRREHGARAANRKNNAHRISRLEARHSRDDSSGEGPLVGTHKFLQALGRDGEASLDYDYAGLVGSG